MLLLFKLILAHILGDFIFQPKSWVIDKTTKKLASKKLYLHLFVHGLLVFLLLWRWDIWCYILIYLLIHFVFDLLKIYRQKKGKERLWFFLDQGFHFLTIFIFWYILSSNEAGLNSIFTEKNLIILTAILFLTQPSAIMIREMMRDWSDATGDDQNDSLKHAGMYIGILERLFVFFFILLNQWIAIGFLITAKSVFRFGDLRDSRNRKLTEYILIGTLISFGFAIITGILIQSLLNAQ